MMEKTRPVLILSVPFADSDRALVTIVMHTTSTRGSQWEVAVDVPGLKAGAFSAQSLATYPITRGVRKLGLLSAEQFHRVEREVFRWLGK